jgi:hypothetical protein
MWSPVIAIRVVTLAVCLITSVLACGRGSQTTEAAGPSNVRMIT